MFNPLFCSHENRENIIVPINIFQETILEKTDLSIEDLSETDLGDIEKIVGITPKKPNEMKALKRGKSRNTLYKFVKSDERVRCREFVTNLLR